MSDKPQRANEPPRKPYDAGDAAQVAERSANSKERETKRIAGLRKIMADADSRLWLWDLLDFCGVSRTSFTGNSTTFFNEGQRNVGLRLQAELVKHAPDQLLAMMKEHN